MHILTLHLTDYFGPFFSLVCHFYCHLLNSLSLILFITLCDTHVVTLPSGLVHVSRTWLCQTAASRDIFGTVRHMRRLQIWCSMNRIQMLAVFGIPGRRLYLLFLEIPLHSSLLSFSLTYVIVLSFLYSDARNDTFEFFGEHWVPILRTLRRQLQVLLRIWSVTVVIVRIAWFFIAFYSGRFLHIYGVSTFAFFILIMLSLLPSLGFRPSFARLRVSLSFFYLDLDLETCFPLSSFTFSSFSWTLLFPVIRLVSSW